MVYIMTIGIGLSEESLHTIRSKLKQPTRHDYTHYDSLLLVNMQVKQVLCTMIQKQLALILNALDNDYRKLANSQKLDRQQRDVHWAPIISTMFLLQMCAEMLQSSMDLRIIKEIEDGAPWTRREESMLAAMALDRWLFRCIAEPFHYIFKSHSSTQKGTVCFNPFRRDWSDDLAHGVCHPTQTFIKELRKIVQLHGNYSNILNSFIC